jgi:uncharacterized DUF497 family protein
VPRDTGPQNRRSWLNLAWLISDRGRNRLKRVHFTPLAYACCITIVFTSRRECQLFDWDDDNENHVREADLEPSEAEEALLDPSKTSAAAYNVRGERRWAVVGSTEAGQILFVVFTRRGNLPRVITARLATKREKRRYRTGGK